MAIENPGVVAKLANLGTEPIVIVEDHQRIHQQLTGPISKLGTNQLSLSMPVEGAAGQQGLVFC